MVKEIEKDADGNELKKGNYKWVTGVTYDKTRPFSISTGLGLYAMDQNSSGIGNITTSDFTLTGPAATLNCDLQLPTNNYKYKNVKTVWDRDAKLSGGLLLLNEKSIDGILEIQFRASEDNTWLYFKNSQFSAKPTENDTNNLECEILNTATGNYEKTYNPKLILKDTNYKLKIPVEKNKDIFMGVSVNNSDADYDVVISAVGETVIKSKN